jgi:16S rRNA (adenine(1408)-N(1))-methyltransferase
MIVLQGKKSTSMNKEELYNIIKPFNEILVDIGTGDGTFIYKMAKENQNYFCIGIDSAGDNMSLSSKKIVKKPQKGGLKNALFVVSSIEQLPFELNNIASHLYVNFPWGSLLEGVVKGNDDVLSKIALISKNNAFLTITTTYSVYYEETEIIKRGLPKLSFEYFNNELAKEYERHGIKIKNVVLLKCDDLKDYNSQWAKKLAFGKEREIFKICCEVIKE